jgi:hypothetical protein
MRVENFGPYELELSARQSINHGGWLAFAEIRKLDDGHDEPIHVLPLQQVAEHAIFASETSAIAAARDAAFELLDTVAEPFA